MKKYTVNLSHTEWHYFYDIEANSEEEAQEKAKAIYEESFPRDPDESEIQTYIDSILVARHRDAGYALLPTRRHPPYCGRGADRFQYRFPRHQAAIRCGEELRPGITRP